MKKGVWLLMLALAGCAGMDKGGSGGSEASMGAQHLETEARSKARIFTELGFAYFNRKQMKVAREEARKAISSDPRYGPAYHLLGLIYMEIDEDKLAEENFRKAIELEPSDSDAHNSYGWFLCTRGRYDDGQAQFTDAMRNPLYDKPELAMTNAGQCSEKKGDLKQAEAYYNKALKLQPNAAQATLKLAALQFRSDNVAEAQRTLKRYMDLYTPGAEALWLAVRIERKLGNKTQEALYNQQLRRNFPDSPEAKLLLQGQYE